MCYTDDPIRDAERHQAKQDRELERRPFCCHCDEPIQDTHYFDIDGWYYCFDCLNTYFKKRVEDYIE